MIKLVIFDLDDTLISEKQYIRSGYKVVSKKIQEDFRLKKTQDQIYSLMLLLFEKDHKNVFDNLLDRLEIVYNKEYIKELISVYREHMPDVCFYDDVVPCINALKNKNIKLGIISDGFLITQKNKLKVLKAYELFDKIILTDELGQEYWKPSPRPFQIMKNFFNVNYEEIMYIGDNPKKDFYIKRYYPIITTRICRDKAIYFNEKYLENIKEDYKIHSLDEIAELINAE